MERGREKARRPTSRHLLIGAARRVDRERVARIESESSYTPFFAVSTAPLLCPLLCPCPPQQPISLPPAVFLSFSSRNTSLFFSRLCHGSFHASHLSPCSMYAYFLTLLFFSSIYLLLSLRIAQHRHLLFICIFIIVTVLIVTCLFIITHVALFNCSWSL